MDTERIAEIASTTVIFGVLAFFVVPSGGYEQLPERVAASAAVAVGLGLPMALYMVYVRGGESYYFGPWGPAELVFLVGAVPVLAGTLWLAERYALTGVAYGVVVVVGLLLGVAAGVVLRDATVGEWPPGAGLERDRDGGPPGGPR